MLAAVDDLRARILRGQVNSLALIIEIPSRDLPLTMAFGRYTTEPHRAFMGIERLRNKICVQLQRQEQAGLHDVR